MIIALLVLIAAFIVSCVALCCSLNIPLLPFVGILLIVVGEMALVHQNTPPQKKKNDYKNKNVAQTGSDGE